MRFWYLTVLTLAAVYGAPTFHAVPSGPHINGHVQPSGLAASHIHKGILYTLGDNGLSKVYAIDSKTGDIKATLNLNSTSNHNWVSIAVGPCTPQLGDGWCIYVADTGYNGHQASNFLYKIREPTYIKNQVLNLMDKTHFLWSEKESGCMMVDPASNVYLVSLRGDGQGRIAKLNHTAWHTHPAHTPSTLPHLNLPGSDKSPGPTGCDLTHDGEEIVLKTGDHVYYYTVKDGDVVGALKKTPTTLPYNKEPNGQAIAWAVSKDGYYTIPHQQNPVLSYYQRIHHHPATSTAVSTSAQTTTRTPGKLLHGVYFEAGKGACIKERFQGLTGMVASRLHPGIMYMHFRSLGNKLVAVSTKTGEVKATLTAENAGDVDWESLAVGACTSVGEKDDWCIHIGDTGESAGHSNNTLYKYREPSSLKDMDLDFVDDLHFSWQEKQSRCLMVESTGEMYIVSMVKGGEGHVLKLTNQNWHKHINNFHHELPHLTLLKGVDNGFGPVGCDITPDGQEILIQTREYIYYYKVSHNDILHTLEKVTPFRVPYSRDTDTGESVAWDRGGNSYYTLARDTPSCFHVYKRLDHPPTHTSKHPAHATAVHTSYPTRATHHVKSTDATVATHVAHTSHPTKATHHVKSSTDETVSTHAVHSSHATRLTHHVKSLGTTASTHAAHGTNPTKATHHVKSSTDATVSTHVAHSSNSTSKKDDVSTTNRAFTTHATHTKASTAKTTNFVHLESTTDRPQHLVSTTEDPQVHASTMMPTSAGTADRQHLPSTTQIWQLVSTTFESQHLAGTTGTLTQASPSSPTDTATSKAVLTTASTNKSPTNSVSTTTSATVHNDVVQVNIQDVDHVYGLAASCVHEGTIYLLVSKEAHSRILAADPKTGTILANFNISGAANEEWEDLAVGPCPQGSCIYLGVKGTSSNTIYRLQEPDVLDNTTLHLQDTLNYRWQEAAPDCIMVDPSGNTYLVSGSQGHVSVGEVPAHIWGAWGGATIQLREPHHVTLNTPVNGDHLVQNVTTAYQMTKSVICDLSPNGKRLLIGVNDHVKHYDVIDGDVFAAAMNPGTEVTSHGHSADLAFDKYGTGFHSLENGDPLLLYYNRLE